MCNSPLLLTLMLAANTALASEPTIRTWTGEPGLAILAPMADDIHLDGDLTDWDLDRTSVPLNRVNLTPADGDESSADSGLNARVAMQWAGQTLYVAASVTAGELEGIQFGYLQVRFQPGGTGILAGRFPDKNVAYLEPGTGSVQDGVFEMTFQQPDEEQPGTPGLAYKTRKTSNGYELEASIDFSREGWDFQPGDVLRVAAKVSYHDSRQEKRLQKGYLVWRQWKTYRGSTAGYWGRLRLLDRDGLGLDLFSSTSLKESEPLPIGGTADAVLDAELASIRLRDSAGNIVVEKPLPLRFQADKRTTLRAMLSEDGVPAGTYTLEAELTGERIYGSPVVIEVEAERVAPKVPSLEDAPSHFYTEDPSRYRKFHLPIRRREVSKNDYLPRARELFEESMEIDFDSEHHRAWAWAHTRGMTAAILYKATGEERYAKYARRAWKSSLAFARDGSEYVFMNIQMIDIMADVMRETGLLTDDDEPEIREHLVTWAHKSCWGCYGWDGNPWFRGAGHAALGPAVARGIAALKYPDVENSDFWTRYCNATLGDSLQHEDTIYNDGGYLHGWMWHLSMFGHLSGREEIFNSPGIKRTWERNLYWMHPMGAHPSLGDATGWNQEFHRYIYLFEMLALHTGDGRYKWAAHRLFEYAEDRIDGWQTSPFIHHYLPWYYALAWYIADDSIAEVEPDPASRVTMRKDLVPVESGMVRDIGWHIYSFELGPKDIPDKVILKSGNDPGDLWAMVECCPITNHNQPGDTTSIICIADQTSVVLPNPVGRLSKVLAGHNRLHIEDLSRDAPQREKEATTVPVFTEGEIATAVELHVENYAYLPVTVDRRILFVKNRMILVRDTARFNAPFFARVGPAFHHQNIGPERGETWSNSHVGSLFNLWEQLTQAFRNPVRDLLVHHAPRPETRLTAQEFPQEGAGATRTNPLRVWYAWEGLPEEGQVEEFTTLLLPHDPVLKVADWVDKTVQVALNEPGRTAYRIHKDDATQELVLMNRNRDKLQIDELVTDASMLYLSATTGSVNRVFATDATYVEWRGERIVEADQRQLLEITTAD